MKKRKFTSTDREQLNELVQMPQFRALEKLLDRAIDRLEPRLRHKSTDLFDLVTKEALTARLDELRKFRNELEREVANYRSNVN